jgi:membrane protease YdiL (CAAX protease family)
MTLGLVLGFPLIVMAGYGTVFLLSGGNVRLLTGPWGFGLYLALLSIPFVAALLARPDLFRSSLAWHAWTPAWLVLGGLSAPVLWRAQRLVNEAGADRPGRVWAGWPGAGGFALLMALVACVVLAEEVVWRAYLLPEIGLVLSSGAFALHHYHFGVRHVAFSFGAGLAWGGLFVGAENLWPGFVSHLLYNALAWRHMRRVAALGGSPAHGPADEFARPGAAPGQAGQQG